MMHVNVCWLCVDGIPSLQQMCSLHPATNVFPPSCNKCVPSILQQMRFLHTLTHTKYIHKIMLMYTCVRVRVRVYVCICVYVYVNVHVHVYDMHTYIHTHTHTNTDSPSRLEAAWLVNYEKLLAFKRSFGHSHVRLVCLCYTHTNVLYTTIHTHIHTCMHAYIHACMHACMHTYINTHIHTYISVA